MGFATNLFAIAVFIGVVVVALAYVPDVFGGLLDGDFFTATTLMVKPETDETVCDLRIKTNADLVQDVNTGLLGIDSTPHVELVLGESHSYSWFNCEKRSGYNLFNLLDAGGGTTLLDPEAITQNSFFTHFGGEIESSVTLIDANDSNQQVTPELQNQLSKTIVFDSLEVIETPFPVDLTFVVADIPIREYDLEIRYVGDFISGVNDKIGSDPFETKICNNFQNFENNRCVTR